MGRPKKNTAETATEERILVSAEAEFGRVGYDAARLEDIAQRAQITRPSLLYYFNSKEALYAAVVRRTFLRLGVAQTEAIAEGGSFFQRLDRVIDTFLRFLRENPALAPLILREALDGKGPGKELLLAGVGPVLSQLEDFVRAEAGDKLPPGFPLREVVMHLGTGSLVRAAAGALGPVLWGEADSTRAIARALFNVFIQEESHGTAPTSSEHRQ
jgi:AcrR family transcriptional regulator